MPKLDNEHGSCKIKRPSSVGHATRCSPEILQRSLNPEVMSTNRNSVFCTLSVFAYFAWKGKVKLSLCLTKHYTMKTYGGMFV
jgi:hypothetical protein